MSKTTQNRHDLTLLDQIHNAVDNAIYYQHWKNFADEAFGRNAVELNITSATWLENENRYAAESVAAFDANHQPLRRRRHISAENFKELLNSLPLGIPYATWFRNATPDGYDAILDLARKLT